MLNRLKNHICYQIGAIDRCPDSGKTWRNEITPFLENMGIIVFNPLKKPMTIGLEDDDNRSTRQKLKQSGKFDEFSKIMKSIRHADLRMVDKCDFVICYIDLDIFAFGTIEEMTICNKTKKPILMVCRQGKLAIPDWAWAMIPHQMMFDTMHELLEYVRHINGSPEINDLGRWIFFNYDNKNETLV